MTYSRFSTDDSAQTAALTTDSSAMPRCDVADLSAFFKALGHDGRLMILCYLAKGEKSVTELEALLGQRQAAVSQQLARLRLEGMVSTRREGKAIYYALLDPKVRLLMQFLPALAEARTA